MQNDEEAKVKWMIMQTILLTIINGLNFYLKNITLVEKRDLRNEKAYLAINDKFLHNPVAAWIQSGCCCNAAASHNKWRCSYFKLNTRLIMIIFAVY